ncbi:unnamed protein product [Fraxinus pennsylvanica]|uniref:Uncharacterized protein n=1 Tax=Fraxinus pennsylvanica TaxID=56036 RepID=A0AAD2E8D3_9LAMI|nr:unnamed protein product [Fraxinus pennsylvanica]
MIESGELKGLNLIITVVLIFSINTAITDLLTCCSKWSSVPDGPKSSGKKLRSCTATLSASVLVVIATGFNLLSAGALLVSLHLFLLDALGSFLSSIILSLVMKITSKHGKPGWVPPNLNDGHLDRYFFLSAALIAFDLLELKSSPSSFPGMKEGLESKDGTIDIPGKPEMKGNTTGGWRSGMLLLVIEGLAALGFTEVEVNVVLFSKLVLRQSNAESANTFSTWMGTLNICTLFGAYLKTVLVYVENLGKWVLAFWISTSAGLVALILLLSGPVAIDTLSLLEIPSPEDAILLTRTRQNPNPWRLCTVTQVEENKELQWTERSPASTSPPASMTAFDIKSTSTSILCYEKVIVTLYIKLTRREPNPPSELQRIGIGMIPQYVLEAFIYVAQWEFFASQIPDGLKSLGLGLSKSSSALGSYLSSIILSLVMKITSKHGKPGWVPPNLNDGHLDRYFFLSAALIAFDLLELKSSPGMYARITIGSNT